jgi:hypothetical protein
VNRSTRCHIRKSYGAVAGFLLLACNELLGLDPGIGRNDAGGGGSLSAGSNGEGGSALTSSLGGAGSGSGRSNGGTGPSTGGDAGTNPSGGGSDSGRGGSGASGGSGGDGGDGGETSCSSTADCIEQGLAWPPHLCLSGACVDVMANECNMVMGAEWIENDPEDQPFVFGLLGHDFGEHYPAYWSVELAMKELTAYGPIPIAGTERRPVLLVCSPYLPEDDSQIHKSLDHLIDVGVSGILLIASRAEVSTAAQYALGTRQADVFLLDTGPANVDLSQLNDGGHLWHVRGHANDFTSVYQRLVERVEEYVNPGASTGQSSRKTRLVLVTPAYDDGFESRVAASSEFWLNINGDYARFDPENYRMIVSANRDPFILAEEVVAFDPDIVFDFAGLEREIDEAARDRNGRLPFYVLPPSQAFSPALRGLVDSDPSLQSRVVGLNYGGPDPGDTALYDAYLERYDAIAPEDHNGALAAHVYDALYYLVYAAVGGGTSGTALTDGMNRRLIAPNGDLGYRLRADIGPEAIASVIELLGADENVNLFGTLGRPSFDPLTGVRHRAASVWCINEDLEFVMDVLRYVPGPGPSSLSGTFSCFENF